MSLTITGVLTLFITQILGDSVTNAEVANFLEVGGLLVGAAVAYYGRFRHGDLTWWGGKVR